MSQEQRTYPLIDNAQAEIFAANGRPLSEITVDAVMEDELTGMDLRISEQTLKQQAQVAKEAGYGQLAANLTRASELTEVPNDELLRMYEALRPNRATYEILQALAQTLESKYKAPMNAKMVREAAEVYKERGLLLKD
ncbi:MAG: diol dehydratase small subunit [Anaerolineae bacterium]